MQLAAIKANSNYRVGARKMLFACSIVEADVGEREKTKLARGQFINYPFCLLLSSLSRSQPVVALKSCCICLLSERGGRD